MNKAIGALGAAAIGALAMYLFDPNQGTRRRAVVKDKAKKYANTGKDAVTGMAKDIANRTKGLTHEVKNRVKSDNPEDQKLMDRVRSAMGHVVTHPHAVNVMTNNGEVMLSGPILTSEIDGLMKCVRGVRGVTTVVNNLEPHETSEGVSALQGDGKMSNSRMVTPASSLVMGIAGIGLMMMAMRKRGLSRTALNTIGGAMVNQSWANTNHASPIAGNTLSAQTQDVEARPTEVAASAM